MSRSVFVDTSAWYALADTEDTYNMEAAGALRRVVNERYTLVTTNHVISETYTLIRARLGFSAAQKFLGRVRDSMATRRVFVTEAWEVMAEDLLAQYDDQDLSYVDATSFVSMRRLGLEEALAFDHHFAVVGFALVR